MNIYCISGLGADERAFQFLNLEPHTIVYIPWLLPHNNESLVNYALRMSQKIDDSKPFALLGLSFGGMLSVEISKIKKPKKLILLSTITGTNEKPLRMKLAGKSGFYKYIPSKFFTKPSRIADELFGAKTKNEKELLNQIIRENNPEFIRWALGAISNWENKEAPKETLRIHGSEDCIFPLKNLKIPYILKGGGHLMVVSHADELSAIIVKNLESI